MRKRLAVMAISALGVVGVLAAPAGAAPVATFCHSIQVTVNGQDVVNDSACNTLPPA